jgi:hypothetical protein
MLGHPAKLAEHYRELAEGEVARAKFAVTNEARADHYARAAEHLRLGYLQPPACALPRMRNNSPVACLCSFTKRPRDAKVRAETNPGRAISVRAQRV